MRSKNDAVIYNWFERNADDDGFVTGSTRGIASQLQMPPRTVAGVVQRLAEQGKVYLIDYCRYVVTDICVKSDDDEV